MAQVVKPFYRLIQGDCLKVLQSFPDTKFGLCLTDPPYGILKNAGLGKGGGVADSIDYPEIDWDDKPIGRLHLSEVFRVSNNQIIFGAEHFSHMLRQSNGWMIWDKRKGGSPCDYADCELIWTSFEVVPRIFYHRWRGFIRDSEKDTQRVHPTQKPVELMEWLLRMFAKPHHTILDPFLGSGTTMLACQNLGLSCVGIEIKPEYCEIVKKRCFGRTFLDHEVEYKFEVFS